MTKKLIEQLADDLGVVSTGLASDPSTFIYHASGDELLAFAAAIEAKVRAENAAFLLTKQQWIDVSVERPKSIEGKDYSENVFGIYKDCQDNLVLSVFQLIYVDADAEGSGWVWAKISENYSDLRYAECKFDDNYEVIRWSPIFELPKLENK